MSFIHLIYFTCFCNKRLSMLERIARRVLKGPIYYIHYVSLVTYLMNRYFPLSSTDKGSWDVAAQNIGRDARSLRALIVTAIVVFTARRLKHVWLARGDTYNCDNGLPDTVLRSARSLHAICFHYQSRALDATRSGVS